jgi:hypothetical protein
VAEPETPPERRPELPLIYANWVRLVPSPFELALDAGYFAPDTPPQPNLRIVMTWEHAKILQRALTGIIQQREENVGEIKTPPGIELVPMLGSADDQEEQP